MIVKSLALSDFRNYDLQELSFHHGINIFYGDNAQGKTNILEGIYLCMTNKSYRGSHDREMIRFGKEEAHLRLEAEKKGILFTRGSSGDKKRSWRAQTLFGHGALPA